MRKVLKSTALLLVLTMVFITTATGLAIDGEFLKGALAKNHYKSQSMGILTVPSENDIIQYGNVIAALGNEGLKTEDIPEIIKGTAIKKEHVARLYNEEPDLNTAVYKNSDGTKTMYVFSEPIKYIDKDGVIKNKSTKLEYINGEYISAENDVKAVLPEYINDGTRLENEKYSIKMIPVGESQKRFETKTTKASVESLELAIDAGPKEYIKYDNVYGADTYIIYTPVLSGIKENIVLDKYTGQNRFCFELETNGLTLLKDVEGRINLFDPVTGENVIYFSDIIVFDSKKDISYGYIDVRTVEKDKLYVLEVVVDERFLLSEETVYPVYIDPTAYFGSRYSGTIEDAPIYFNRQGTAHGTNEYNLTGYVNSTYGIGRTLMRFPEIMDIPVVNNVNNYYITGMDLHFYEGSGNNTESTLYFNQYIGPCWTESTVKCSSMNWYGRGSFIGSVKISSSGWNNISLMPQLSAWRNNNALLEQGIIIINGNEASSGYMKNILSSQYSSTNLRPYITIEWEETIEVSSVHLWDTSVTVNKDESFDVSYNVYPRRNDNTEVRWSTSDSSVAVVNAATGVITTKKPGIVFITATSVVNPNIKSQCKVTVKNYLSYPDTLMNSTASKEALIDLMDLESQVNFLYGMSLLTYTEKTKALEDLELQKNEVRADYIIVGNNPKSTYAKIIIGGSSTASYFPRNLYFSHTPFKGVDVILVQRTLELYGYFEPDENYVYGTYDLETDDAASQFPGLLGTGGVFNLSSFNKLFSSENITERTYEAMNALNQFRLVHNAVAAWTAQKVGGSSIQGQNVIKNGGRIIRNDEYAPYSKYPGYADVLKFYSNSTYVWEVKSNYFGNYDISIPLATTQLDRYILAANNKPQNFATPLIKGPKISNFNFEFLHLKVSVESLEGGIVLYQFDKGNDYKKPEYKIEINPLPIFLPVPEKPLGGDYVPVVSTDWGKIAVTGLVIVGVGALCVAACFFAPGAIAAGAALLAKAKTLFAVAAFAAFA